MPQRRLYGNPEGLFVHQAVLACCQRFPQRTAIVDTSCCGANSEPLSISYGRYGELVESAARGLVAAGVGPGEVVAIHLCNGWEFPVAYHAATLAGAIPTLLNPSYREREIRYQLETSESVLLITDGPLITDIDLSGLPKLRSIYCTRSAIGFPEFKDLLVSTKAKLPTPRADSKHTLAALPFSSGTTGLPKGVMLSHYNLVANAYQTIRPGERAGFISEEKLLCFLPLYHIYGLNVLLNPMLMIGGTIVLMPRFDAQQVCDLIAREQITYLPLVPPAVRALSLAAEQGLFPAEHKVRAAKSGAAPLAPELPRRFSSLTGIPVAQGYGMTEASPVTHLGFIEPELYRPESIGHLAAETECKLIDTSGNEVGCNEDGELVMRGPQMMLGYWKSPAATSEVLRDGWYWSGDVGRRDERDFFFIVDRRKEMIKYKGFAIAPAEIEAVLLEHPEVRDCGIVGKSDDDAGEIPVAFVVTHQATELSGYVAERLASYKQPREVRFVDSIPRNPSGKILRRELRANL